MTEAPAGAEPQSGLDWLRAFEREQRRPLRVLHIGNIANNAYNNAKIQRRHGIDADVACWDYYHVMGSPEWEEAEFEGDLGDLFFPDWWAVDLNGYRRPRWFVQGRLGTTQRYLLARRDGSGLQAALLWRRLTFERWLLCRRTPVARALGRFRLPLSRLRLAVRLPPARRSEPLVHPRRLLWYGRVVLWTLTRPVFRQRAPGGGGGREAAGAPAVAAGLDRRPEPAARYRELFPERATPLAPEDYAPYLDSLPRWAKLFERYDIVQAYATDPIIPYLCRARNYTAYEHGTLREIPFEDSPRGRLCALSYREAPLVFVTNPDVVPATQRIPLDPARTVLLPHAVDSDRLHAFADAHAGLRPAAGDPVTFVSPTRQDWVDRDPSWTKGNDRAIRALAVLRERGLRCTLLLAEWGRDLGASRALVDELGVGELVGWIPALRKSDLWKAYLGAHAVVDQFALPGISGVTFESLGLGCRVLAFVDLGLTRSFFGEEPPLLTCSEPEEIADAMEQVILDPLDKRGMGPEAHRWFQRYHSAERIVELQATGYRRVLADAASVR